MRWNRVRAGLGLSLIGWTLACAGPEESTGAIPVPAPAAGPTPGAAPSGPPVLGAITTFEMDGAGCGCTAPSGTGSSYLSDPHAQVMNIDGADRRLSLVSEGSKGENRRERLSADGYTVDMVWKELTQVEGGATYDVKVTITQGDRPPLKATLSCGCGC